MKQKRFLAALSWHPYDHFKSPGYAFTVILHGLVAVYAKAKVVAFDCLLYGLLSRQIVQHRHLKNRLKRIISNVDVRYDGEVRLTRIEEIKFRRFFGKGEVQKFLIQELCLWIKHHQELISLGNLVQQIYSPMLLLQFFCQLLMLCSNAFVVTAAHLSKLEIAFSFGYVVGNILQLLILCYFGETLIIESRNLLDDGFGKGWYACPPEMQSIFKVMFQRIQTPFKISAIGVFPLSIETFRSIIGTAFSYLMVLQSLKKRYQDV